MRKYITMAVFAAVLLNVGSALADAEAGGKKRFGGGEGGAGFMDKLTDEQKTCIEQQGCPKMEFKKGDKDGEKPDKEKPDREKPDKEKMDKGKMGESRECMNKAFETCGIEMPERPDKAEGGKKFKKPAEE